MAKKGFLATFFGGGGKRYSGSRSSKARSSSSKGRSTSSKTKSRSSASKRTSSASKTKTHAKQQTKTPSKKRTAKKVYEKPMVLMPVTIKDHRDRNGGHHHVIVDNVDDKHISVGLTKDKYKGKNATNYKCQTSPLGDGKESYMRRQAQVSPKKEYYNSRDGKMELSDYDRAQEYGARAKKKYLEKKSKKNSNEVPNA